MTKEQQWLLIEKYGGVESEAFHADCKHLHAGEPLAYIIGSIPFLDTIIHLDSHPLIPRPETEYWVENLSIKLQQRLSATKTDSFAPDLPKPNPPKSSRSFTSFGSRESISILDLCAGSGCIGVALAKALPGSRVDLAEIDPTHLSTIKKNCAANAVADRAQVIESDLFPNTNNRYDIITSNPPYIDKSLGRTEESVVVHEPALALYGGQDGMEIISNIISQASSYLHPQGELWLEHEPEQSTAIKTLGTQNGFTVTTHTDQYAVERYSILVLQ